MVFSSIFTCLKNLPIPSTETRSLLRCLASHNLLWYAVKPNIDVQPPQKSQKPLLWNSPFFAEYSNASVLLSLNWLILQQCVKLFLKPTTGRCKLDQTVRDPAAILFLLGILETPYMKFLVLTEGIWNQESRWRSTRERTHEVGREIERQATQENTWQGRKEHK